METDQQVMLANGKILYFSVYIDGTQVTENRATEAIVLRVRIDNLPGAQYVWRTIGILVLNKNGNENQKAGHTKRKVLQRLLFLIIKQICSNPYISENVCARISCMLVDQPQERDLACLLRSNTFRNCSSCRDMFGPAVERDILDNDTSLHAAEDDGNYEMNDTNDFANIPFFSHTPLI